MYIINSSLKNLAPQCSLCGDVFMKTWKTIKLGTGPKTADDFRKAIYNAGMCFGNGAVHEVLRKSAHTVAGTVTEVELVVASVAEVGFKKDEPLRDFYARCQKIGLALCTPEFGPQLRLQYTDQPRGEWLNIAMEPVTSLDDCLDLFSVGCDEHGRWLHTGYVHPGFVWCRDRRFVFHHRR